MRDFVSGIAKGLTEDCFEQVKFALDIFKTHVALDETLGRSVKVSFFNNYMLEQVNF